MKLANRLTFLLGVMAIITGCTTSWMLDQPPAPPPPESSDSDRDLKIYMNGMDAGRRAERGEPKFHGEPAADGLVDFDLVGEWEAMRYSLPDRKTPSPGRWQAKYTLCRDGSAGDLHWLDENGQGYFSLTGAMPQHLVFTGGKIERTYSINEWSFGMLKVTGDDGEQYLFVRREGGEGDLPKLEYAK